MTESNWLAERFEENRGHLRGVAYRMLGSLAEAEDAVQEAWLRLSRSDAAQIDNLGGWLTTVVGRVCLDHLRSRAARKEEALEAPGQAEPMPSRPTSPNPEQEALLADSVGVALLVVLDRLQPAERLAFVLHDLFNLPFEEIATVVGRSPEATRQLASRARRRVRGVEAADLSAQRATVDAFLKALRAGDVDGLLAVLDPDLVARADRAAATGGVTAEVRGAETWARSAVTAARGARFAQPAVIDGTVGLLVAPRGRLFRVLRFTFRDDRIVAIEVIGDPERLQSVEVALIGS